MQPNYDKARATATKILAINSVIEPPVPVIQVAENLSLSVVSAEFEDSPSISGYLDLNLLKIVVNRKDGEKRQAFTIAHEIGHFLLHQNLLRSNPELGIIHRRPIGGETDPVEKEANAFAANLLVPEQMLFKYLHLPSDQIADIFGVSEEVINYRRRNVSFVP